MLKPSTSSLSWKQRFVDLNVFMAVFHRLATRWLSRIEKYYSRSQVASYLAHTGGLCPEEGSVLRSGTAFHYSQDHAEQSRLKSLLMVRNETPERKAKVRVNVLKRMRGRRVVRCTHLKRDSVQTSTPSTQAPFSPSTRSIGLCAIWVCVSPSSSSPSGVRSWRPYCSWQVGGEILPRSR